MKILRIEESVKQLECELLLIYRSLVVGNIHENKFRGKKFSS